VLADALAVATLKPVGPIALCTSHEASELTAHLPPLSFIWSYSSLIPLGGAIVIRALPPKKPTTGMLGSVVVRPGAAIRAEFDWKMPELARTGAACSRPLKATMPPATPVEDEKRHVKGPKSEGPATL
jgi:hypothetical protein